MVTFTDEKGGGRPARTAPGMMPGEGARDARPPGSAGGVIRVLARVRVLATEDGGRSRPFTAGYRPNHNFGDAENRHYFIGQIEVPDGEWVQPGESRELTITFMNVFGLRELLTPGGQWRIQEGGWLVATAEVLSLL